MYSSPCMTRSFSFLMIYSTMSVLIAIHCFKVRPFSQFLSSCQFLQEILLCYGYRARVEPRSDQTKEYKLGICCFSVKHIAFRRKSKYWLAQNQDSMSEWGDCELLCELSTNTIMLIKNKARHYHHPIKN